MRFSSYIISSPVGYYTSIKYSKYDLFLHLRHGFLAFSDISLKVYYLENDRSDLTSYLFKSIDSI